VQLYDGQSGKREYKSFDSEKEATLFYKSALRKITMIQGPPISEVMTRYKKYLHEKGNKQLSIDTTMHRLGQFFSEDSLPFQTLTERNIEVLYAERRASLKTDSHRNELAEVKTFFRWAVKNRFIRTNPAEHVEPTGKRHKGKPQLRVHEAKLFLDRALESAQTSDGALAVSLALLLGLRSSEIRNLTVRDIDRFSRVLVVENAKTSAGNRRVEIPTIIWPYLEARLHNKNPFDPLFPSNSQDGFHLKGWVCQNTKRICKELGIAEVSAHGLRGTHATISQEAGISGHAIAKQLGHESERTTFEHYIAPGTQEKTRQNSVLRVLEGGQQG
jgi:integrase